MKGSNDDRFDLVAKHLRGFDKAMVETGHRYIELYWAGEDQNWGYAGYQLEKIRTAINNGTERRPARAASARMIYPVLDGVQQAIDAKDANLFQQKFETLTATCNACHHAEEVSFIPIAPPRYRASSVVGADDL